MTDAVIARWDAFLANIAKRHGDLLAEAVAGCEALHLQSGLDPSAMTSAFSGINRRALDLESKIMDAWSDKVDDALDDAGASSAVTDRESAKGEALADRLELERERARVKIFADAARRLMERASLEQRTEHLCTQCGALLAIPEGTSRAVNVTCAQCQSVNTYEPGTWARWVEGFCVHPLTEEASWDWWVALRSAEARRREARNTTLELIQAEEQAMIVWNQAYFRLRAGMFPAYRGDEDAYLRGRMAQFYTGLEHEGAWKRAGQPRRLPAE